MPRVEPTLLAAHIRRIAPAEAPTDAELVGRYAEHRDAAAFEVLVWRHGPMVWATCRRVLCHQQDAEDAFQAAFLALARTAGTLGTRQAVAGWLHRVAMNAAINLRTRRRTTGLTGDVPAPPEPDGELTEAVDEELERLPDRMRTAFVLCCLEGRSSAEAARELGCPVGTVDSRLHAARARLRDRLTRRGFGPGATAVLAVIAPPASLVAAAVGVATGALTSPAVAALARHSGRITTHGALPMKAGICTLLVMALAGTIWAFGSGDGPSSTPKAARAAPRESAVPPGPVTAWGEPVDGLQAGLRASKRVLGPGESVEVELVLRNVGKYPVSFDYRVPDKAGKGVEISGLPERFELRLGWATQGGNHRMSPGYLRQDDELVRGRVTISHAGANAIRPGPRIELAPGTYRVSLEGNPGDRLNVSPPDEGQGSGQKPGRVPVDFPNLKTGVLELVLSRDAVVLAAPAPRDARGEARIALLREGHPRAILYPDNAGSTLVVGRLTVNSHAMKQDTQVFSVGLEIDNLTAREAIMQFDPKDLKLELLDAKGTVIEESPTVRSGPAPMTHKATLPTSGYVGLSTYRGGIGLSPKSVLLAAGWQAWVLKPGTYRVRGTATVSVTFGGKILDPEKPDVPEPKPGNPPQALKLELIECKFELKMDENAPDR